MLAVENGHVRQAGRHRDCPAGRTRLRHQPGREIRDDHRHRRAPGDRPHRRRRRPARHRRAAVRCAGLRGRLVRSTASMRHRSAEAATWSTALRRRRPVAVGAGDQRRRPHAAQCRPRQPTRSRSSTLQAVAVRATVKPSAPGRSASRCQLTADRAYTANVGSNDVSVIDVAEGERSSAP